MTIRKTFPPRDYETFSSSNASEAGQGSSDTPTTAESDKSRLSAAQEAQRLASQGSWADNVFRSPGTTMTPPSTVDEEDRQEVQRTPNEYLSDPPPQYTPTDTTANTMPSSPVTVRAELVGGAQTPQHASSLPPTTEEEEEEDQPMPGAYSSSSPLLERADREPGFIGWDQAKWHSGCKTSRGRRFKKTCAFALALLACLWLMLPSLWVYNKVLITLHKSTVTD
jgi:hypothetical protein